MTMPLSTMISKTFNKRNYFYLLQALNEKVANRYGGGQKSNVSDKLKASAAGFASDKDAGWGK